MLRYCCHVSQLQHRPTRDEDRLPIVMLDPIKNKRHPLTPTIRSRSVDLTIHSRSWVDGRRTSWMPCDETVTTIYAQGGRRLRRALRGEAMVVGRRFRLAGPHGERDCCVVLMPRPGRRGRCRLCCRSRCEEDGESRTAGEELKSCRRLWLWLCLLGVGTRCC